MLFNNKDNDDGNSDNETMITGLCIISLHKRDEMGSNVEDNLTKVKPYLFPLLKNFLLPKQKPYLIPPSFFG